MTTQASTRWRPVPHTVTWAAAVLVLDAALICVGPLLINAPSVYDLVTNRPTGAHPDPLRELTPLIIGSVLWLALAATEVWGAAMIRRARPWGATVATVLLTVGLVLAVVFPAGQFAAGLLALPFGYTLVGVKFVLWLGCLAMLWLPQTSRDYFRSL
ncbi:MAG TPA: hypothetical protein VI076_00420 [Actinopolymorphaceae bacterium]